MELEEDQRSDPLLDAMSVLEGNSVRARNLLTRSRRAFKRLHGDIFPKKEVPADFNDLVAVFNADPSPLLDYSRVQTKTGSEITMALAMAHGSNVDWEKVSSSLPIDETGEVPLKPFLKKAKKHSKLLVAMLEAEETSAEKTSGAAPVAGTTPPASGM